MGFDGQTPQDQEKIRSSEKFGKNVDRLRRLGLGLDGQTPRQAVTRSTGWPQQHTAAAATGRSERPAGHKPQQAATSRNKPLQAAASRCKPLQAATSRNKPQQAAASRNKFQEATTGRNKPQQCGAPVLHHCSTIVQLVDGWRRSRAQKAARASACSKWPQRAETGCSWQPVAGTIRPSAFEATAAGRSELQLAPTHLPLYRNYLR